MSGGRVLVLSLLMIVLGTLVYTRVLPQRAQLRASLLPSWMAAPIRLSNDAVLSDGSFNPISPLKLTRPVANPDADAGLHVTPAMLASERPWRAAYKNALQHIQPNADAPGFYVYPFADCTREGVGTEFTYGWKLEGGAALAMWTDARLVDSSVPPQHWGLSEVTAGSEGKGEDTSEAKWTARALADPATQGARYIVTGCYGSDAKPGAYNLKIWLVDRAAAASPAGGAATLLDLASQTEAEAESNGVSRFEVLAAQQRAASHKLAEALIARGIAGEHKVSMAHGLDMRRELRQVAAMLDAGDGWLAMDGVDRALQLAAIFPGDSTPLQAAAYGLNELNYTLLHSAAASDGAAQSLMGQSNPYAREYALRAFALEQVAGELDATPGMTQMNVTLSRRWFEETKTSTPTLCSEHYNAPELEGLNRLLLGEQTSSHVVVQPVDHPDWLMPAMRQAAARPQTNQAAAGVREAMQASLAAEGAALVSAVAEAERESQAGAGAGAASGIDAVYAKVAEAVGADASRLREAASSGNYYTLRAAIGDGAMAGWAPLSGADARHPYFGAIAAMADGAEALAKRAAVATGLDHAASGYAGFEFTPLERVRVAQRTDHTALHVMAADAVHASVVERAQVRDALVAYTQLRPDNAAAQMDLIAATRADATGNAVVAGVASEQPSHDAMREISTAAMAAEAAFPLANAALIELAEVSLGARQQAEASAYLETARRRAPFGAALAAPGKAVEIQADKEIQAAAAAPNAQGKTAISGATPTRAGFAVAAVSSASSWK